MHPFVHELLIREKVRDARAQADAARLARLVHEVYPRQNRGLPRQFDDVLQKVGSKFVAIYLELYQKSKEPRSPQL